MLRSLLPPVSLFMVLAVTGCGGDGGGSGNGGGTGGGTGGSGGQAGSSTGGVAGSSGGTGGGPSCAEGPGYPSNDTPHLVKTLNATIQDLDGNGASGVLAQACGLDICINGSTDDNGVVVTCNGSICTPGIAPNQVIKRPAFKYGDGFGYVKFAELLSSTTEDYDLGIRMTAPLPAISAGVAMEPGGDATSGGVSVSIPAGGDVKIDLLVFDTPELAGFRAAEVPIAKAPAAVDSTLGFEIIVGTTPLDTEFCPRAKLSVPNTPAWPAGTEVEVYIHGLLVDEEWAPYAGWAKISDATVSSDGTQVVTNDGADQGIPLLATFGFRMKP